MDLRTFKDTLMQEKPPTHISTTLEAMWVVKRGEWEKAHDLLQDEPDDTGAAWVHAHLHRIEGDLPNARYWYRRADRPFCDDPLDEEWDAIATALLNGQGFA